MPAFMLERLPQDRDELYEVVQMLWGVVIPRHKVCPEHCAPFDAFSDAYFGDKGSIAVWKASRGLAGKSFALAILGLTKAVLLGTEINLLGGSLAQSQNIHDIMRVAWEYEHAPTYMIRDNNVTKITLTNKARIHPLTASQKTVRGPHPPFLLLDEIDEMDLDVLNASLGQPLPQVNYLGETVEPYTVMSSTWQNPEGTMTDILRRAEERDWPVYEWCFKDTANPVDGWLSQATIERKKDEISHEMWRVEYELGEPSIGSRAFDVEAVERMFTNPMEPVYEKVQKDYEEYVFEEPFPDFEYVAGADWGKEQDYTVISVFNASFKPARLAYYLKMNRRPYPIMIDKFNQAIAKYRASAAHDATGLGNVVNDYLDSRARKFLMVGRDRHNMLSEYIAAVERDELRAPLVRSAYVAHKYCQVGDIYSNKEEFHLPDEVCSFALSYYMMKRMTPVVQIEGVPKNHIPRKVEQLFIPPKEPDGIVIDRTELEEREFKLTV